MRCSILILLPCCTLLAANIPESVRQNLTLHASFDTQADADHARGDRRIQHAADYKVQTAAKAGIGDVDAVLEKGSGIGGGGALRFQSKNTRALFFSGDRHVNLARGTVSFWLRLDPQKDLAPGFCDPIQVTDKAYNDSALWVDFTKDETPRHFRLGVFGSLKAWNPNDVPPDKNPDFMKRLIVVQRPPFSRDQWTHVAITWANLGASTGTATLFLNGKMISSAKDIREPFEWDPKLIAIRLGVNYVGLMDEVAAFNRALTEQEIAAIHSAGTSK